MGWALSVTSGPNCARDATFDEIRQKIDELGCTLSLRREFNDRAAREQGGEALLAGSHMQR